MTVNSWLIPAICAVLMALVIYGGPALNRRLESRRRAAQALIDERRQMEATQADQWKEVMLVLREIEEHLRDQYSTEDLRELRRAGVLAVEIMEKANAQLGNVHAALKHMDEQPAVTVPDLTEPMGRIFGVLKQQHEILQGIHDRIVKHLESPADTRIEELLDRNLGATRAMLRQVAHHLTGMDPLGYQDPSAEREELLRDAEQLMRAGGIPFEEAVVRARQRRERRAERTFDRSALGLGV